MHGPRSPVAKCIINQFLKENDTMHVQDFKSLGASDLAQRWLRFLENHRDDRIHFHTKNRVLCYLDALVPGTRVEVIGTENVGGRARFPDQLLRSRVATFIQSFHPHRTGPTNVSTAEQRKLCCEILESLPNERLGLAPVRDVCRIAHRLPEDPGVFAAMDGAELRSLGGSMRAFGHLDRAKRQPRWDPQGRYASHWATVPKTLMAAHPTLWDFPVCLARTLMRFITEEGERTHYVLLAKAIGDARVAALPKREATRIRAAVAEDMCHLVRSLSDRTPIASIRILLPFTCTRIHLVDVLSHIQARTNRRRAELRAAAESEYRNSKAVVFINGAIQKGLFEPNVRSTETISDRELIPRMQELEQTDATRWQAVPPETAVKDEEFLIGGDSVFGLGPVLCGSQQRARWKPFWRQVAHYPRATTRSCCYFTPLDYAPVCQSVCVFFLRHHTEVYIRLRAAAIANMIRSNVWDAERSCLRSTWVVTEKFSERRHILPCDELCNTMRMYLQSSHYDPRCTFLFGSRDNPQVPNKRIASTVCRRVCRLAGIRASRRVLRAKVVVPVVGQSP